MFYLGSMLFFVYARINRRDKTGKFNNRVGRFVLYILSALCGMLAFLSKQNTASLPAAIILMEYLLFNGTWNEWKRKLPWFVLVLIFWFIFVGFIAGLFISGSDNRNLLEDVLAISRETETVGRWQYLCTQFNVLVIYMRLLFLPINQNLDYMYPFKTGFFDGLTPLAFVLIMTIVAFGAWNIRKRPVISFSIFFFFITLSVESGIIPIRDALFEHRLYLTNFGFGIFVAYGLSVMLSARPSIYLLLSVLIVIGLGTATYRRNTIWQDSDVLWADVIAKNPDNNRAHNNRGIVLAHRGT